MIVWKMYQTFVAMFVAQDAQSLRYTGDLDKELRWESTKSEDSFDWTKF